jgi:peptide methionine sulfoxide reductase MsrB
MNSKGNLQATSIRLTSDQHQRKKSKPACRSTTNHFGHTYNDGASSKTPLLTILMKEQLMLSQLDYDEQI